MSGAIELDAINAVALRSGRSLVQDLIPGGRVPQPGIRRQKSVSK